MKVRNISTGIFEGSWAIDRFPGISGLNQVSTMGDDDLPTGGFEGSGHEYTAEYTDDELKALAVMESVVGYPIDAAQQVLIDRYKLKLLGSEYAESGVLVPFKSEDAVGLLQVKAALEMGAPSTVMVFSNGQKLPLTPETFPAFAVWFTQKRNSFYQDV